MEIESGTVAIALISTLLLALSFWVIHKITHL